MTITKFTLTHVASNPAIIWDVAELVEGSIKWETDIEFAAGALNFSIYVGNNDYSRGFHPSNGDIVDFHWDNKKVFYGRVFKVSTDEKEIFQVTAYDNLRYLKGEDALVFPVSTARQRFERIMKICQLPYKVVSDTTYKVKAEVCDGDTYFNMMKKAIEDIKKATGNDYFLRTNYNVVEFAQTTATRTKLLIDENSTMTSWSFDFSADELYNVVKVVKTDSESKSFTSSTAAWQDSIHRYGRLSKVEKAESDMNQAQMDAKANQLLRELSNETNELTLEAIGTLNVRAGNRFFFSINSNFLKDLIKNEHEVLAKSVTHVFDEAAWTMQIKARLL